MEDLNLELEALRAIYSSDVLFTETNDHYTKINIQLTKERTEDVFENEYRNFIKIKLSFLVDKNYPIESTPLINHVNISLLKGKYSLNECDISTQIEFDKSSITNINSNEVINYYNQTKDRYIGRICLFDIIEDLQSFIDDMVSKYISNLEKKSEKDIADLDSESEEIIYTGLIDRVPCPLEERVTFEQFNIWKEKFKAEMIEKNIWKNESLNNNFLTGKQLFEKDGTLVKSDDSELFIGDNYQ